SSRYRSDARAARSRPCHGGGAHTPSPAKTATHRRSQCKKLIAEASDLSSRARVRPSRRGRGKSSPSTRSAERMFSAERRPSNPGVGPGQAGRRLPTEYEGSACQGDRQACLVGLRSRGGNFEKKRPPRSK